MIMNFGQIIWIAILFIVLTGKRFPKWDIAQNPDHYELHPNQNPPVTGKPGQHKTDEEPDMSGRG